MAQTSHNLVKVEKKPPRLPQVNANVPLSGIPEALRPLLKRFDTQNDGVLDAHEIRRAFGTLDALQESKSGTLDISRLPTEIRSALSGMDLDGSGTVDIQELTIAAELFRQEKKTNKSLVRAILVLLGVILFLFAGIFCMMWVVVDLSKDTEAGDNGILTVRGKDVSSTSSSDAESPTQNTREHKETNIVATADAYVPLELESLTELLTADLGTLDHLSDLKVQEAFALHHFRIRGYSRYQAEGGGLMRRDLVLETESSSFPVVHIWGMDPPGTFTEGTNREVHLRSDPQELTLELESLYDSLVKIQHSNTTQDREDPEHVRRRLLSLAAGSAPRGVPGRSLKFWSSIVSGLSSTFQTTSAPSVQELPVASWKEYQSSGTAYATASRPLFSLAHLLARGVYSYSHLAAWPDKVVGTRGPEESTNEEKAAFQFEAFLAGNVCIMKDYGFDLSMADIVTTEHNGDHKSDTTVLVARSSTTGDVAVAFKGSYEVRDFVADLDAVPVLLDFADTGNGGAQDLGWAHRGFTLQYLAAGAALKAKLLPLLQAAAADAARPDWKFLITGHSLGGAKAVLAALDFATDPRLAAYTGRRLHLVTFGQPAVGMANFVKAFEKHLPASHYSRFVTGKSGLIADFKPDPISMVPPWPFAHVNERMEVPCFNPNSAPAIPRLAANCHYMDLYLFGMKEKGLFADTSRYDNKACFTGGFADSHDVAESTYNYPVAT